MPVTVLKKGQATIRSFIKQLFKVKGMRGHVELHAFHGVPEEPRSRGAITAGTGRAAFTPGTDPSGTPGTGTPPPAKPVPPYEVGVEHMDGSLRIGEVVEFEGKSPRDGWIHLFNLGTSGEVTKLAPSEGHEDNKVTRDATFAIPSERLFSKTLVGGHFIIKPPSTQLSKSLERILAIVTADNVVLNVEDLHPRMIVIEALGRCAARGGVKKIAGDSRPLLFQLPPESWDYELLELELLDTR